MKPKILYISLFYLSVHAQFSFSQTNTWEKIKGPSNEEISCIAKTPEGKIFIADDRSGIYKSEDQGQHWERIFFSGVYSLLYREMIIGADDNIYIAARNNILVMEQNHYPVYSIYLGTDVFSVALNSQLHLYAATLDSGILRTTNYGIDWEFNILFPDSDYHFTSVAIDGMDNIFVGSYNGVFRSTDNGSTWYVINNGLTDLNIFDIMCTSNDYLFLTNNEGVARSTNSGENWEYVNNGILDNTIGKIVEDENSNLFICDEYGFGQGSIYKTSDWGENWNLLLQPQVGRMLSLLPIYQNIFIGSFASGFFVANMIDSTLTSVPITHMDVVYFVENQYGEYFADSPLRISTDQGNTWRLIGSWWSAPAITSITYIPKKFTLVGAYGEAGMILNKKINMYWILGSYDDCGNVSSIVYDNDSSYVFASTEYSSIYCPGGIYRGKIDSTLIVWPKMINGIPNYSSVTSLSLNKSGELFASVEGFGIFKSDDRGLTWISKNNGLGTFWIEGISIDSRNNIYAYSFIDLYSSTDNGESWFKLLDASEIEDLIIDSLDNLYLADYNQVTHSTDNGISWENFGDAFQGVIRGLFLNDSSYLYVYGTFGIYRTEDPVTGINTNEVVKLKYSISQNYPNPFNPVTRIYYTTGSMQFVILKVYDILGREVATLVNEEKPAGEYQIEFNRSNLSSGVYFYRLQAGDYRETKKMILLK